MTNKWQARQTAIELDNDARQRRINRAASIRRIAYIMLILAFMFGMAAVMIWVVIR